MKRCSRTWQSIMPSNAHTQACRRARGCLRAVPAKAHLFAPEPPSRTRPRRTHLPTSVYGSTLCPLWILSDSLGIKRILRLASTFGCASVPVVIVYNGVGQCWGWSRLLIVRAQISPPRLRMCSSVSNLQNPPWVSVRVIMPRRGDGYGVVLLALCDSQYSILR